MTMHPATRMLAPAMVALALAGCNGGSPQTPTSASKEGFWASARLTQSAAALRAPDAGVSITAAGDIQNGPIEIHEVRIRRGAPGAQVDIHPNALAGTLVRAPGNGQEIEMWVTWSASPLPAAPPRLVIDFGDGFVDNISCGSCLLRHAYPREGRYTVKVLLDDRVGGATTRTFTMEIFSAPCGRSVSTNFDSFANGTLGTALGIPGLSVSAGAIQATFSTNTSGQVLLSFVDTDLTFTDDQAFVQFDFARNPTQAVTMSVFNAGNQLIQSGVLADTIVGGSGEGHASVSAGGIRRIRLQNSLQGFLIDSLSTTATCGF